MSSGGTGKWILMAATLMVVAAVVAGIAVLGSPAAERRARLDAARLADLRTIERLTASYSRVHRALPDSLEALAREPGYSVPANDPDSRAPYVYKRLTAESFQLCAVFDTDSATRPEGDPYGSAFNAEWMHGQGLHCFERHVKLPEQP